jgi:hypothetical protein
LIGAALAGAGLTALYCFFIICCCRRRKKKKKEEEESKKESEMIGEPIWMLGGAGSSIPSADEANVGLVQN